MRTCTPCHPRHRACHIAGRILLGALLALVLAGAFGLAVQLLWNHVLAVLLPVHTVSYCQALGLLILARLLFGGFHHGRHHPWRRHGRGHGCGHGWGHGPEGPCCAAPEPGQEAPAAEGSTTQP